MAVKTPTKQERIGRVGQRRQVVIPRDILETLNIREGDFVAFTEQPNGVLIKPKRIVDRDEHTPEQRRVIDAQLAEGLADIKAGRVHGPFATHKEFIESLHRAARKLSGKKVKRSA